MTVEIPMFPLGGVLLPGAVLPLHIFEDRYRSLIRDVLAGDHSFGVTFITRGNEVGGGDQRSSVGVIATIVEASRFDDGRWAVASVAGRRFRVVDWLPDDPYPRAIIDWWDEQTETDPSGPELDRILTLMSETATMATQLGYAVPELPGEFPVEAVQLSYALTAVSPLGPTDRFDLLCAEGPRTRLELLERRLLDQQVMFGAELAMGSGPSEP